MTHDSLQFEGFILDLKRLCLQGRCGQVDLRRKSFEVLRYLAGHAGRVVSKEEMISAVWPNLTVSDESLTQCISEVRRALGDKSQRIIKTIPRRGYLLDVPVVSGDVAATAVSQEKHGPSNGNAARRLVPRDEPTSAVNVLGNDPERRQLTIMACNMVGPAAVAARLDTEDFREVVAAYYRCVQEVVQRHDGLVAKYLPEGVLAYFGYPQAREDDVERAVRSGLAVAIAVSGLKIEKLSDGLQARVGIATGLVVVGDTISNGQAVEHVLVGDTPLLATRLASLASPNAVVVSASTRRLVGGLFEYHDLGVGELQGPVDASRVLGEAVVRGRFEALRGSDTSPLVGREEELDLLMRRWEQAKTGNGRVVLLTGEAGIGKSRMAKALQDRLAAQPHTPLIYHCSPNHQDTSLHPIVTQLVRASRIERNESAETRLAKLEALLAKLTLAPAEHVAVLAALLSLPGGGRCPLPTLTPRQLKERTFGVLLDQLKGHCAKQPVLVVFEDLQWIDPTSLELLTHLVEQAVRLPFLLVATARPEFKPPWPNHSHISIVALTRLGRPDVETLIARVVRGKPIPPEVLAQIVARTDGVPLFIEELTKTVLEGGLLQEVDDRYVLAGPLPPLAIPSTLHASLLARLDRLASVKDIAQIGAAIGREFSFSLIAAVSAMPKQEVEAALAKLVAAELIFQRGVPPDATYQFKHALVQDAAYVSLLRSRRSALHEAIVKKLVAGGVSGTEVKPELLAHHCAEADMAEDAVRHYLEASEQSVARSALAEAAVLLDKALGQVAQLPAGQARDRRELEVQSARGAVLIAVKGFGAAETGKAYARARDLWDGLDRPPKFLSVARGQWSFHLVRSEFLEAQSIAEDLLEFSRTHGDTGGLILGCYTLGQIHLFRGELLSARASLEEVIRRYGSAVHGELFRQAGTDPNVMGLAYLGHVLSLLGYPDQALLRAEEAIRQARRLAHAPTMANCLATTARAASTLGDEARLAHWAQELRAVTQEHGYPHWSAHVPIYEGQLQLGHGEAAAAVTLMRQGLEAYRAIGASLWSAHFAILLAEALEQDGKSGEALALLDEQITIVARTGVLWYAAELHRLRGRLLLNASVPDFAGAEAEFLQAMDIARRQSAKLWELRAAVSLARLRRVQDRNSDAHHLLSLIYAWFTEGFDCADLQAAKLLLAELNY